MQEIQLCKRSSLHLSDLEKALHQSIEVEGVVLKYQFLEFDRRPLLTRISQVRLMSVVINEKQYS